MASVPALTSWTKGIPMARAVVEAARPMAWTRAAGQALEHRREEGPGDVRTSAL